MKSGILLTSRAIYLPTAGENNKMWQKPRHFSGGCRFRFLIRLNISCTGSWIIFQKKLHCQQIMTATQGPESNGYRARQLWCQPLCQRASVSIHWQLSTIHPKFVPIQIIYHILMMILLNYSTWTATAPEGWLKLNIPQHIPVSVSKFNLHLHLFCRAQTTFR